MNLFSLGGVNKSTVVVMGLLLVYGFPSATEGLTAGIPTNRWNEPAIASLMTGFGSPRLTKQPTQQKQPPHKTSQSVFEDDRIRVGIPAGWSVQPATETVTGDRTYQLPIGALFTKGRYKLYLLSHHGQASGIEGGRFSEVVEYISPWIDMSESPWLPCPPQAYETVANDKLSRTDLYFDTTHASKKALVDCGKPTVKGALWYGSYFVETCQAKDSPRACGGFFLTYQDLSGKPPQDRVVDGSTLSDEWQMTYALTYDTTTPNALPMKGDPELRKVLREASEIVSSIVYK